MALAFVVLMEKYLRIVFCGAGVFSCLVRIKFWEVYYLGKTTTDMQLVPIDKLVPYVNNARTHSPEQITKLRSSLREFGFVNPVIIDRDFNVSRTWQTDGSQGRAYC